MDLFEAFQKVVWYAEEKSLVDVEDRVLKWIFNIEDTCDSRRFNLCKNQRVCAMVLRALLFAKYMSEISWSRNNKTGWKKSYPAIWFNYSDEEESFLMRCKTCNNLNVLLKTEYEKGLHGELHEDPFFMYNCDMGMEQPCGFCKSEQLCEPYEVLGTVVTNYNYASMMLNPDAIFFASEIPFDFFKSIQVAKRKDDTSMHRFYKVLDKIDQHIELGVQKNYGYLTFLVACSYPHTSEYIKKLFQEIFRGWWTFFEMWTDDCVATATPFTHTKMFLKISLQERMSLVEFTSFTLNAIACGEHTFDTQPRATLTNFQTFGVSDNERLDIIKPECGSTRTGRLCSCSFKLFSKHGSDPSI
jgi:hypothetical protein